MNAHKKGKLISISEHYSAIERHKILIHVTSWTHQKHDAKRTVSSMDNYILHDSPYAKFLGSQNYRSRR